LSIHIKQINVKNLGPLAEIKLEPARVNLIYGKNEKGKTHLVEFLIRSLFRKNRSWSLRNQSGGGNVLLAGLTDQPMFFSPSSPRKIEDLWGENGEGLPLDFQRLLVVKGGELELVATGGGADKSVIKSFLSSQNIFDKIRSRIAPTIRTSSFLNGVITIKKQGEGKTLESLQVTLTRINDLFEKIDKSYSGGQLQLLAVKKKEIAEAIQQQDRARRFEAFNLQEKLKIIKNKITSIPGITLQELKNDILLFNRRKRDIELRQIQVKEAEVDSRHFTWLESAVIIYEKLLNYKINSVGFVLPLLTGLGLAGAIFLAVINFRPGLYAALGLIVVSGFFLLRRLQEQIKKTPFNNEMQSLAQEFEKRFHSKLSGLTSLEEKLKQGGEARAKKMLLEEQISSENQVLHSNHQEIERKFLKLTGKPVNNEDWENSILIYEKQLETLNQNHRELELKLAKLGVDETEYLQEVVEDAFDRNLYDKLSRQLQEIDADIKAEEHKLQDLKTAVFRETNDKNGRTWEAQIAGLQQKRTRLTAELKQIKGQIIGRKILFEQLEKLEKNEDEKLARGLQSAYVTEPLKLMTGRYNGLRLADSEIMVSDDFEEFKLADLSTGAREQVLLAMRIGFTSRITTDQPMFMILDDAFQHSDWQRREKLVDQVFSLAELGWQILYFTMDDHIRSLFEKKSEAITDQFKLFELD